MTALVMAFGMAVTLTSAPLVTAAPRLDDVGSSAPDAVSQAKQALRERVLNRRAELSPRELAEAGAGIRRSVMDLPGVLSPRACVAAFVSVGREPGTGALLEELAERGIEVILPVQTADGDLDWARFGGPKELVPAARGVLEPRSRRQGRAAIRRADVVLVPGLAVDGAGMRLGRGGGSYDRALARLAGSRAVRCVLLHDGEVLDLPVPHEPHDMRVHAAATPSRLVWTTYPRPA